MSARARNHSPTMMLRTVRASAAATSRTPSPPVRGRSAPSAPEPPQPSDAYGTKARMTAMNTSSARHDQVKLSRRLSTATHTTRPRASAASSTAWATAACAEGAPTESVAWASPKVKLNDETPKHSSMKRLKGVRSAAPPSPCPSASHRPSAKPVCPAAPPSHRPPATLAPRAASSAHRRVSHAQRPSVASRAVASLSDPPRVPRSTRPRKSTTSTAEDAASTAAPVALARAKTALRCAATTREQHTHTMERRTSRRAKAQPQRTNAHEAPRPPRPAAARPWQKPPGPNASTPAPSAIASPDRASSAIVAVGLGARPPRMPEARAQGARPHASAR